MILYRDMTRNEYVKLLVGDSSDDINYNNIIKVNSFIYNEKESYMHFFKYLEHARIFNSIFGRTIVKCIIPNELIEEEGYGFYQYKNFNKDVPIPEVIIKKDSFTVDFIDSINPKLKNNTRRILGVREVKLYNMFLRDLYYKWILFNNSYDDYGFCYYFLDYLNDKNIEGILTDYAVCYLERKGKIKNKRK